MSIDKKPLANSGTEYPGSRGYPEASASGSGSGYGYGLGRSDAGPSTIQPSTSSSTSQKPPQPSVPVDIDEAPPGYDDIDNTKPYRDSEDGSDLVEAPPTYEYDPTALPPTFSTYVPETHAHYLNEHLVTHDPHLNTDGEALYRFLLEQIYNPPRQLVKIHGYHHKDSPKYTRHSDGSMSTTWERKKVDDFLFSFDLSPALEQVVLESLGKLPPGEKAKGLLKVVGDEEKVYRGGRNNLAMDLESQSIFGGPPEIPDSLVTIREWADRYCHLPTTLKEFVVRKPITNLDETLLKQLIQESIRETTNFKGKIDVTFPKTHHKIAVYPETRFSRLRQNPYVRWFFYLTFLWIITWPILYLITHKFHVVVIEWKWGFVRNPVRTWEVDTTSGSSELAWVRTWRDVIRLKVRQRLICRRSGEVLGAEDYKEAKMRERFKKRAIIEAATRGCVEHEVMERAIGVAVALSAGVGAGALGGFRVGQAFDIGLEPGEVDGWGMDE
ncbi:hypothetical protein DFH27DRAFT_474922 [Peziza echinospora]|nr:hypothetical protein DFH27DRAFT_474922 [Peziza echinospora]